MWSCCTGEPECVRVAVAAMTVRSHFDGSSTIQMDQMVVTFTMLEGLTWSDGDR